MPRFIHLTQYYHGQPVWLNVAHITAVFPQRPDSYAYKQGSRTGVAVISSGGEETVYSVKEEALDVVKKAIGREP